MKIGFKKVHPDAVLPKYAHEGDAGMDVYAVEDVKLYPFTPTLVKTGLVADIPTGYEIQVRPRSGLALKQGVTVFNTPGTLDSGFVGQIGIILIWTPFGPQFNGMNKAEFEPSICIKESWMVLHKGDRIAQLVVAPVTRCEPVEVTEVSDTERGTGGFGSTGV